MADLYANGYEQGTNDVWEMIKKIENNFIDKNKKIFGEHIGTVADIVNTFSPSEALKKVKEYESKDIKTIAMEFATTHDVPIYNGEDSKILEWLNKALSRQIEDNERQIAELSKELKRSMETMKSNEM